MPLPSIVWPHERKGAVSLTYDDALSQHHRMVGPFLQSHGIKGTFYTPINARLMDEMQAWRQLAHAGHELGNHTLFHPCYGEAPIPWLDPGYNLRDYTPKRWQDEIRVANWALQQIDDRTHRTYGNTCHNRWIGPMDARVCLDTLIPQHFVAGRGENTKSPVDFTALDFANLGNKGADRALFRDLREELIRVREAGTWIIYTFHGVGPGEHELFIDEDEHKQLVEWLAAESNLWVAPVVDIATWLRENLGASKAS